MKWRFFAVAVAVASGIVWAFVALIPVEVGIAAAVGIVQALVILIVFWLVSLID